MRRKIIIIIRHFDNVIKPSLLELHVENFKFGRFISFVPLMNKSSLFKKRILHLVQVHSMLNNESSLVFNVGMR
jgi:hypothetical protein